MKRGTRPLGDLATRLGTAFFLALAGCTGSTGPVPVACGSVPPTDPDVLADTLAVTIALGQRPTRTTDVLVRVDSLSRRGAVLFSGTPPESAAAVSVSLTTDAVFQGCVNERADGFRVQAEEAPMGRIWVRVSSNRPVTVRLVADAVDGEPLVVAPGMSGRRAWTFDTPPRGRE